MERDRRYGWDRDRWGRDERYGYGREEDDHRWRGGDEGPGEGYRGGSYTLGSSGRDDEWRSRDYRGYGSSYGRDRDDEERGWRGGSYRRGELGGYEHDRGMAGAMRGMMERGIDRGREMMGRDRDESGGYGRTGPGEHGGWGSDRQREGWGARGGYGGTFGTGARGTVGGYGAYGGGYGGTGGYGRAEGPEWERDRFRGGEQEDHDERGFFQRMGEGIRNVFGVGDHERGPFFGKGPKGYKRSDERIREEVSEVIARQGWIDASDVEVKVQNGEVILTGTVQAREHKRRLEMMIEDVPGVDDIRNELRIKRPDVTTSAGASTSTSTYSSDPTSERGRNARSS